MLDLKRKGQEGPLEKASNFARIAKVTGLSCYPKRLSNKYGKKGKNNKFNEILHLEREKAKKGLEKAANFEKIATKVTRILIAIGKTL